MVVSETRFVTRDPGRRERTTRVEVNAIELETGIDGRGPPATDRKQGAVTAHQQSHRAAVNALWKRTNGGDMCTQT